jgi:hypothetical protein
MTAPVVHCPFHHGPSTQCPPLDSDLADLIAELAALHVDMRIVQAPLLTVSCEDCTADTIHDRVAPAVVWLAHRAPSEPLPDGFIYRDALCSEHLYAALAWQLRRGSKAWVEILHDFRQVA